MKTIILLGPPGAGKGTVAEALIREGFTHISTGDMLRKAISAETNTGMLAKSYMDQGKLVPDEVVISTIKEVLQGMHPEKKLLLDGFPRTLVQAEQMDGMLAQLDQVISDVVLLQCPDEVIITRLSGRRVCKSCGATYHEQYKRTAHPGVCDVDAGCLVQRKDDTETTIRSRLDVYRSQTEPVVCYYKKQNLIRGIDATQSIDDVVTSVLAGLN